MDSSKVRVLFVCLGNICRSPAAEGNFHHLVKERSLEHVFEIDSAGTSAYHIGEPANSNARRAAARDGVDLTSRARQFKSRDFDKFDYILAMDHQNYRDILAQARKEEDSVKVRLFREFDPSVKSGERTPDVPDPYFGGMDGFEKVQSIMKRTSAALLDSILKEQNVSS